MLLLNSIFGGAGFLPHGYCFTWTPALLWSMVGADGVIAAAYFSIPLAILSFVRKRDDAAINQVALLFSAFIFSCGTTHVMDIWTIWRPDYGLQALTKTITAGISLVTAVMLWPLIPRALRLPSVQHLQSTIATLEAEIGLRREAERQVVDIEQILAVQQRAEAALRASEERLRFTLESAHVGDWELDFTTGITWHSLRHDRCFGYEQAQPEWSVESFLGHVHPEDPRRGRAALPGRGRRAG